MTVQHTTLLLHVLAISVVLLIVDACCFVPHIHLTVAVFAAQQKHMAKIKSLHTTWDSLAESQPPLWIPTSLLYPTMLFARHHLAYGLMHVQN
jgi:hypothetical protein